VGALKNDLYGGYTDGSSSVLPPVPPLGRGGSLLPLIPNCSILSCCSIGMGRLWCYAVIKLTFLFL